MKLLNKEAHTECTPAAPLHIPDVKTSRELEAIVTQAARSGEWIHQVRLCADRRWYTCLHQGPDYDLWLISWLPGQSTGFHDHGASTGAFVVTAGMLEEHRAGEESFVLQPGVARTFGNNYVHDVRNGTAAPAISIHAYSPPLTKMNVYELDNGQLVPHDRDFAEAEGHGGVDREDESARSVVALGIDARLAAARDRLRRVSAVEAHEAAKNAGAILVDIRPKEQRAIEGSIPGALTIERNVLEWRLDPRSDARLSIATGHDLAVILFCSEGYASSLAAEALQQLGMWRATDVIGGFQAWRAAELPVASTAMSRMEEI